MLHPISICHAIEGRYRRWGMWILVTWLGVVLSGPLSSRVVRGQDDPQGDDAALAPVDAPVNAPADGAAAEEKKPEKKQSYLMKFINDLGPEYFVAFLALSFVFVALLVMNILATSRNSVCPVQLVEGFEQHLNEKKYQEAYELAKGDESFLGQVLSAGLAKLQSGYAQAIEAMQQVGEEETMKLEQQLSYIQLIGTISPMIGLLGTVHGMVESFTVIATATGTPKPSELAEGISKALLTTLVGLLLAIPAIAIYHFLRNRIARLVLEVGIMSEGLMSRFENLGGPKP